MLITITSSIYTSTFFCDSPCWRRHSRLVIQIWYCQVIIMLHNQKPEGRADWMVKLCKIRSVDRSLEIDHRLLVIQALSS